MRPATAPLRLTDGQREILEKLAVARAAPHREVTRARALLRAGDGAATTAVAQAGGASPASGTARAGRVGAGGLAKFATGPAGRGPRPAVTAREGRRSRGRRGRFDPVQVLSRTSYPGRVCNWADGRGWRFPGRAGCSAWRCVRLSRQ